MKSPSYLKMLVVEDDILMGEIIKDYFVDKPYDIITAQDGEEAFLQATQNLPDIIVMDLILPKMDGVTLIEKLRQHPEFAVTPIVAVTAGSQKIQEDAYHAGAHLVLQKPLSKKNLTEKVDALVRSTPFLRKR